MAAVVCELVYLNRIENSNDLTFDIWRVTVCIQVIQCLSIIASCLFYMKPFVDSLETGFVQLGDLRRRQVSGFGYSPENRSRNPWRKISLGSLKINLSRSRSGNEDTELQENVTDGRQRLGNFAIAVTEPCNSGTQSQSHIVRTTTLTVDEGVAENSWSVERTLR